MLSRSSRAPARPIYDEIHCRPFERHTHNTSTPSRWMDGWAGGFGNGRLTMLPADEAAVGTRPSTHCDHKAANAAFLARRFVVTF